MKDRIIDVHGKGGSVEEAEHYRGLFPEAEVVGFDYHAQTPWRPERNFHSFSLSSGSTATTSCSLRTALVRSFLCPRWTIR